MLIKPTELPRWAELTDGTPASNIVDPPSGNKDTGWTTGEDPPSSWENWKSALVYHWIEYLNSIPNQGLAAILSPPRASTAISTFSVPPRGLVSSPVVDVANASLNIIIAVGDDGTNTTGNIRFSNDAGRTWTTATSAAGGHALTAVCQKVGDITGGTNLFVAVGKHGVILTSPTGATWTSRTSGTTEDLTSVVWNGTVFATAGTNNTLLTSTDGTTWTSRTTGMSATGTNIVAWGAGPAVFVCTSNTTSTANSLATSVNGTTWTLRTAPQTHLNGPSFLNFSTPVFVACAASGALVLYTSPDGITWTSRLPTMSQNLSDFVLTESGVGAGWDGAGLSGQGVTTSVDGITWVEHQYPASVTAGISAAVATHGGFLAMTDNGSGGAIATLGPCFPVA